VIDPLLVLPANLRSRLLKALESGALEAPYTKAAISSALGSGSGYSAAEVAAALTSLADRDVSGPAVALALDVAARSMATVSRPDLVWSGPTAPGIHTRGTRQVYEELIGAATREVWISTYAYFDGQQAFRSLADRMEAVPDLRVRLLLNIPRKYGDVTPADALIAAFAEKFWNKDWPGPARPDVYYDQRSLELSGGVHGVLHAKAVVVDDAAAFITSANITEAAFDHNIEVGIITRDALLATSLSRHFRLLVDHGLLSPLPGK
jgi:phosphatidylserine/phosphatidylglycerophosphate/cardiolipin synthase-like enzyme